MSGHALPSQNYTFSRGSVPPSNTWFLGSIQLSTLNGISIGSAVFAQMTAESPIYNGPPLPHRNCPFPWGEVYPHPIHGSLGAPDSLTQPASRPVQPFLQGSLVRQIDIQTDRQTDGPRYSIGNNGRI